MGSDGSSSSSGMSAPREAGDGMNREATGATGQEGAPDERRSIRSRSRGLEREGGGGGGRLPEAKMVLDGFLVDPGAVGPQTMTDFILASFEKVREQGGLDLGKTLSALRTLSLQAECFNLELARTLVNPLTTQLGVPPAEWEEVMRREGAVEVPETLEDLGVKLEGGVAFGRIPRRLSALDDRVSAVACTVSLVGGACRVLVNDRFKDTFWSASEILSRLSKEVAGPPFLFAALVAVEDRLDFLEAMTAYVFGPPTQVELSQIVKVRDAGEQTFLAMIRLRTATLAGGTYLATMLSISPAPSSKYIRGGNKEGVGEEGLTWLGLNQMEAKARVRPPSAVLAPGQGLGNEYEACNIQTVRVQEFLRGEGGKGGWRGGRGGEGGWGGAAAVPSMPSFHHQQPQQQQHEEQPPLEGEEQEQMHYSLSGAGVAPAERSTRESRGGGGAVGQYGSKVYHGERGVSG